MELKRIKPIKAVQPEKTIEKIKAIFAELGMSFLEEPVKYFPLFSACKLSLINPGNHGEIFSTFGKGITPVWALASAWGEMAERFANLAFYMINIYPSQPENGVTRPNEFKFYPDEKVFAALGSSLLLKYKALASNDISQKDKNVIGIPFINMINDKIGYLPFRALQVIVGSNGMCSGNTKEEALIQGISEIFERYVLKALYLNPFCPPDIPPEYFDGCEIQNKIKELVRLYGYQVTIKDCSMGKGYPVIGVLVRNMHNGYAFHLGADPSPVTALERCFTEMYQGGDICFLSIDELNRNIPCDFTSGFWEKNFSYTISAYAGHWPHEIFLDRPAYTFNGFDHPVSFSDEDDLNYLLKILSDEKREVFIRDNSYLGQPAYYIYIPGMSEITCYPDNSFSSVYLEFDDHIPTLVNLPGSTLITRKELLQIIARYQKVSPNKVFRANDYFSFFREHPVARLSPQHFTFLLNQSLQRIPSEDHFTADELENDHTFLQSIHESDETSGPTEIFQNLRIPSCFECPNCYSAPSCNFPFIMKVWEQVKARMESFY